jgi:DNA-binding PadR family transcriptional regulator
MTSSPEPALLGFLLDGPLHGYDLYKQVDAHLSLMWHVGMSQMYAIINSYATRGWIQTQVQSQELRPSKKVLEITPAGRKAFEEWLHQPARGLREFRVDFFLRLYFARRTSSSAVQTLIDQQIKAVRQELANLDEHRITAADEEGELFQLTRNFRLQQLTTILKWLETNRGQLIRLAKASNVAPVAKPKSMRRASPRRKNK